MTWIWIFFGALVALAGFRYRGRLASGRSSSTRVDDEALRRIIEEGTLSVGDDEEPLDLEEAARAEEEFWDDWEEPEEYRP